jgi:hypothetical protein
MKSYLFLLLCICYACGSAAQFRNILIDPAGQPNEPSIIIDPKNTKHLVAGSNLQNVYSSADGGLTWTKSFIASSYGVWGDPIIIVDTAHSFYYFHLSNTGTTNPIFNSPGWIDRMVCQRMDNFSGTWNNGSYAGADTSKKQDKPGLAYDSKRDKIYMTWTEFDRYGTNSPSDSSRILFSSSSDHGNTWSPVSRISSKGGDCVDDDNTVEGATPCVGPNGEVYVAWAGPDGLVFNKSLNGGTTWLPNETFVSTIPGGWDYNIYGVNRCNGLPFTACDISNSPYKGNIYINWSDQRNGLNNTDVWICRSANGGNTWSAPIRVNDDTGAHQQFLSSMTIDQTTGYIYVLFYDRRNEVLAGETEVYLAVSKDGGNTFKNIKVSQSSFRPDASTFFGDYTGITAHNGVVRPIWTRMDAGITTIWTAIGDTALEVNSPLPSTNRLESIYPNPFKSFAEIPFTLGAQANVTLAVYDMLGRPVASIYDNQQFPAGYHVAHFTPQAYNLPSGIYTFQLRAGGERLVKQAIYTGL